MILQKKKKKNMCPFKLHVLPFNSTQSTAILKYSHSLNMQKSQLDLEQCQSPMGCEWHIFTGKYTAFMNVAYFQKSHTQPFYTDQYNKPSITLIF